MDCRISQELLGTYIDGELSSPERVALEAHLGTCGRCAAVCEKIRALAGRIGDSDPAVGVEVPAGMWEQIEQRLDSRMDPPRVFKLWGRVARPMAAAASLGIVVAVGLLVGWMASSTVETAHAGAVDYSVLLDGVETDVDAAVTRFVEHYQGRRIQREQADGWAPELSFSIPQELPGGFVLEAAYGLRFDVGPGVAGCYRRGDEPLVVFFHKPVAQEELGVHRQSHCMVAGRDGYRVEVGSWRLVHFTDATTCHCVLSRLDVAGELPVVLAAVAPSFSSDGGVLHETPAR